MVKAMCFVASALTVKAEGEEDTKNHCGGEKEKKAPVHKRRRNQQRKQAVVLPGSSSSIVVKKSNKRIVAPAPPLSSSASETDTVVSSESVKTMEKTSINSGRRVRKKARMELEPQLQQHQQKEVEEQEQEIVQQTAVVVGNRRKRIMQQQQPIEASSKTTSSNSSTRDERLRLRYRNRLQVDTSNLVGVHRFDHGTLLEIDHGFEYSMRRREKHNRANVGYLNLQSNLSRKMRATLFDWMFEVGQEFVLGRETLHTALTFVDRYFSKVHNIAKSRLQLVGVTALWIAAKQKEIYAPRARDFAFATDGAYTAQELIDMEMDMLFALDWVMEPVTCNGWVEWYCHQLFRVIHPMDECIDGDDDDNCSTSTNEGSPEHNQFSLNAEVVIMAQERATTPTTTTTTTTTRILRQTLSRVERDNETVVEEQRSNNDHPVVADGAESSTNDLENRREWLAASNVRTRCFKRIMEIVDVALLDINSLHFLPSAIGACAVMHVLRETNMATTEDVELITKYTEGELSVCMDWMEFAFNLERNPSSQHPRQHHIKANFPRRDWHCFQHHHRGAMRVYQQYAPDYDIVADVESSTSDQWSHSIISSVPNSYSETTMHDANLEFVDSTYETATAHNRRRRRRNAGSGNRNSSRQQDDDAVFDDLKASETL